MQFAIWSKPIYYPQILVFFRNQYLLVHYPRPVGSALWITTVHRALIDEVDTQNSRKAVIHPRSKANTLVPLLLLTAEITEGQLSSIGHNQLDKVCISDHVQLLNHFKNLFQHKSQRPRTLTLELTHASFQCSGSLCFPSSDYILSVLFQILLLSTYNTCNINLHTCVRTEIHKQLFH